MGVVVNVEGSIDLTSLDADKEAAAASEDISATWPDRGHCWF